MKKQLSATMKLAMLGALLSTTAFATNGMLTTARSARSAGMGGTSIAVTGETASAVETNPANIAFATRSSFSLELGVMSPSVNGKDMKMAGGKSHDANSSLFPIPSFSYTHVTPGSDWTFGIGAL
ncbi:MAG: hypothetical protein KAH04_04450, partial [Psychrilyobacter sp.]|nr:hypothetical protein [Psychrilyobacter sp.]